MDQALETVSNILRQIPPIVSFVITFIVGTYVYWRGCVETRKNRSSIFDTYIVAILFSVVFSRLAYVISNWSEFSKFIWYWLPYEKYGNDIYLFRLLPWKFFAIWDGGVNIIALFVGFLIILTLLVVLYKKWSWKQMYMSVYITSVSMLAVSFLYIGLVQQNLSWVVQGLVVIISVLILFGSYRLVDLGKVKLKKRKSTQGWFAVGYVILTGVYVSYIYLTMDLVLVDTVFIYLFISWILVATVMYILSLRKGEVSIEKLSSVSNISVVDVNQPIKLPKGSDDDK